MQTRRFFAVAMLSVATCFLFGTIVQETFGAWWMYCSTAAGSNISCPTACAAGAGLVGACPFSPPSNPNPCVEAVSKPCFY
jgi:hypothetical protein